MDNTDLIGVFAIIVIALFFGARTARSSSKREKILGGTTAQALHFIASCLLVAVLPTVLVSVFVLRPEWTTIAGLSVAPFVQIVGIAFGLTALAFIVLLVYAAVERPALQQVKTIERGWTKEDATTSGL
jgi:hypothetical protein